MLRLGSVLLSALLLGVPRALEARSFGSQRSVYVEIADADPDLADFAGELSRAIELEGHSLALDRARATTVVEVHGLSAAVLADGTRTEAVRFTLHDGGRGQPRMLSYEPGRRARAARALLASLPPGRRT